MPQSARPAECLFTARPTLTPEAYAPGLCALFSSRRSPLPVRREILIDTCDGMITAAGGGFAWRRRGAGSRLTWSGADQRQAVADAPVPAFACQLPPGPLRDGIAEIIGPRRLRPWLELERRGTLLDVLDGTQKTICRIRIESCRARRPLARAPWRRLPLVFTLSGLRGFDDEFDLLRSVLATRPDVAPSPHGLLALGLLALDERLPSLLRPAPALPGLTAGAGFRRMLEARLLEIDDAMSGIVDADDDPGPVQDLRAGVRRTRTCLEASRRVLSPATIDYFATEARWVGSIAKELQGLHVLFEAAAQPCLPATDTLEDARNWLDQRRRHEHGIAVARFASARGRRFVTTMRSLVESPVTWTAETPLALHPFEPVVAAEIARHHRRLRRRLRHRSLQSRDGLATIRGPARALWSLVAATTSLHSPRHITTASHALGALLAAIDRAVAPARLRRRALEEGHRMERAGLPARVLMESAARLASCDLDPQAVSLVEEACERVMSQAVLEALHELAHAPRAGHRGRNP